ncbi:hypothetical protein MMC30_007753 [Trapelia coarctata]|nr:hypothetical protein [Trapelia coarctata]
MPPTDNTMDNLAQHTSPNSVMEDSMKHEDMKRDDTDVVIGHMMSMDDPENPFNWPRSRKVFVSAVSFAFSFVVAFGATAYTAGISGVITEFEVSTTKAILGLSLYLFGIAFAPVITPHLSERFGRSRVYQISLPVFSLFIVGAGASQTFASLAICRFFAGMTGGPCLVLIEGTFADVWAEELTGTYYAVLAMASYVGAGAGPLIGGFVFASTSWRWTQWVTLMLALAAYLLGIGMPETYPRHVLRLRAKRFGLSPPKLLAAGSGTTLKAMFKITVFTPVQMLFAEPVVVLVWLYLGFNFAVIFAFFIAVPAVLQGVYGFSIQQVGLAFIAAIVGSMLASATSIIMDRLTAPSAIKRSHTGMVDIEYRLYPAMIGGVAITASLFWIGWTASPSIRWPSPVIGTLLYVWGNQSVLSSLIPYIFDAYPPTGTLSALTAMASVRLSLAAFLPLVILQMFQGITGAWSLSLFGFVSAALLPVPFVLFKWGAALRARSKHGHERMAMEKGDVMQTGKGPDPETHMMGARTTNV